MKNNVKRSSKDETGEARLVRGHVGLREGKVMKISSVVERERSGKNRSNGYKI